MVKRILPLRQLDRDLGLAVLDQPLHLADRLARHDHAGHAGRALGHREIDLRQAMAVGGDAAQRLRLGAAGGVQIDAVEIVARLFRRDRKLRAVDQPFDVGGRQREGMRHVAGGEIGKVALGQRLQREARAAGADRQHRAVAVAFEHDLRAVGQLAHDVVEHVRGNRGRAASAGLGGERLRHLEIEIGRLQRKLRVLGAQQHVAEDRDGVAPLDHAVHVAQRFQELRAFDGDLHCNIRPIQHGMSWGCRAAAAADWLP